MFEVGGGARILTALFGVCFTCSPIHDSMRVKIRGRVYHHMASRLISRLFHHLNPHFAILVTSLDLMHEDDRASRPPGGGEWPQKPPRRCHRRAFPLLHLPSSFRIE